LLQQLSRQLRIAATICLGTTLANLALIVLLFLIYAFNQRSFRGVQQFTGWDIQNLTGLTTFILVVSSGLFIASLVSLYWFEYLKRQTTVISNELLDELGWYSKNQKEYPSHIDFEERIVIKLASENLHLPFFTSSQSAAYYIGFNLTIYVIVAYTSLFFLQMLTLK
jgi:hypothetical protein